MGESQQHGKSIVTLADRPADGGISALLLDPSGTASPAAYWPLPPGTSFEPLLPGSAVQPDGGTPLLIDVSDCGASPAGRRWLETVSSAARFANAISIVHSALTLSQLAAALRERTGAILPEGLRVVLRFFDTRVAPLLPRLLEPAVYDSFMACATQWWYLNRWGVPEQLAPAATTSAFVGPLRFDAEQEALLISDGLCDGVVDQLLELRHPAMAGLLPPEQYERVKRWADAAARWNIDDVLAVTEYCCAAHEYGEHFADESRWREHLEAVAAGTLGITEALERGAAS